MPQTLPRSLLALALAGLSSTALAERSLADVNFTGPLVTPAVNTLPAGKLNIEPYLIHTNTRGAYDNDGDRHARDPTFRQWQLALPMTYGLTDVMSLQLTLNGLRAYGGGFHTDGFRVGDTAFRVQQRLKGPRADGSGLVLSLAAAQRFPTGKYHQLDSNPLNGTGNGATRTTLTLGAQQLMWLPNDRPLRWRGQVAWSPTPGSVNVRGASVYGTGAGFRGRARLGQAWNATIAAEYSLDARWVLVGEAIWNRTGTSNVWGRTADGIRVDHRNAPGQEFSLAPAVEYHFNGNIGLIAGVQFSVAGRNSADYVAPQVALNMVF